jgi:hypothetical protein
MSMSIALAHETSKLTELVAGTCFLVGVALIGAGAVLGFLVSKRGLIAATDAPKKLAEASRQLNVAHQRISDTRQEVENLQSGNLEGIQDPSGASAAAAEAESSATAAKSALEQVSGIVGALPENLRFSGVLLLVGTVLVSVATTQFGGTPLF